MKSLMAFGMLSFVAWLVLALYSLVYGIHIVMPEITEHSFNLYIVIPVLIEVASLSGDALGAFYLFLVAAILLSAAWVFLRSFKDYYKELVMKAESRKHSQIFDLCALMFAVLFLTTVVALFSGVLDDPSSPVEEVELWELLFLLANASVWEELVVRVLMVGIPMLFVDLIRRAPKVKPYRYILGGGFKFGWPEVTLIMLSSIVFGVAHFEGWGAWKVFPAAVAGVAFGYMFMRHGLASAILLHFGFDYLSIPIELFMDSSEMSTSIIAIALMVLAWTIMGAAFFVYYLLRIGEFLTKREILNDQRLAPMHRAPYRPVPVSPTWGYSRPPGTSGTPGAAYPREVPQPMGPGRAGLFVCPVCGSMEARWLDTGKFQCSRCGGLF